MGKIFIFIGQFGNQIGLKLLTAVRFKEQDEDGDLVIAVDTESKVVNNCRKNFPKTLHRIKEVVTRKGRGSNWAMGYHIQCEKSDSTPMKQKVVELVQRFLERNAAFSGFVVAHSLIGGTGGGLGSSIIESLREEFPASHITSITIGPFVSGESPLQHYNSLLTLSWLQRFADNIMIFHNDDLMHEISRDSGISTVKAKPSKVSIDQMNDSACFCITNLLHPFSIDAGTPRLSTPILKAQQRDMKFSSCGRNYGGTKEHRSEINHHECTTTSSKAKSCKAEASRFKEGSVKSVTTLLTSKIDFGDCKMTSGPLTRENKSTENNRIRRKSTKQSLSPDKSEAQRDTSNIDASISKGDTDCIGFSSCFDELALHDSNSNYFEEWNQILQYLTPDKDLKIISSYQKRSKTITTDHKKILLSLLRDVPKSDLSGSKYKNVSAVLVTRGECFRAFEHERYNVLELIKQRLTFINPVRADLWASPVCVPEYIYPQALTLYINNNRNADFLSHVVTKSSLMYQQSAYLHWYSKFGCTKDYFEDAFETLSTVVQQYKDL